MDASDSASNHSDSERATTATEGEAEKINERTSNSSQNTAAPTIVKTNETPQEQISNVLPRTSTPGPRQAVYTLLKTTVVFFLITSTLLVIFSWKSFRSKNAWSTPLWRKGGTYRVEITLVQEDRENLSCASGKLWGDLYCGFLGPGKPNTPPNPDPKFLLKPYSTITKQIFIGAGLWAQPDMQGELPDRRFTVVCEYTVTAVVAAPLLRWRKEGKFDPHPSSLTLGQLDQCVISE